jgi:spore coat polysaccharide biosynthesis predicted glycosyltransferase SpsG
MELIPKRSLLPRQFIIHADANQIIGSGHVLRLVPIAEELLAQGFDVIFVGNISGNSWVQKLLEEIGVSKFYTIKDFHFSHLHQTLIFDSYSLNPDHEFLDSKNWDLIISIIDNNSPKYQAHLYINPFPFSKWEPPLECENSPVLSGLNCILLRNSLRKIKQREYLPSSLVPRIVVSGGGVDNYNFCVEFTRILKSVDLPYNAIIFASDHSDKILDPRISYKLIGRDFEDSIFGTDIFFTTSGLTSWELMANGGVVGVAVSVANQLENYKNIVNNCLGVGIGERDEKGDWHFDEALIFRLIVDIDFRMSFFKKTQEMISTHGAKNVIAAILEIYS